MGTLVIIDGYNVIKYVFGQKKVSQQQRTRFIVQLTGYLRQRALQGLVVFDGGDTDYPAAHTHGEVRVIFSGYKQTADAVIMRYMQEHRAHEFVLVTSDHELRAAAHALGKQTVTAHEFYHHYLEQEDARDAVQTIEQPLTKMAHSSSELDALMQEATRHMQYKEEDGAHVGRRTMQKTISKKERVRERILDKLR